MAVSLVQALDRLDPRHRAALEWFVDHAGTVQEWPDALSDGTLLATRAKGIYKPEWSEYALSVRQTIDSPYADRDPERRDDGTWTYVYHQEGIESLPRLDLFTNRALTACLKDRIPVGVLLQATQKPDPTYTILGVALVARWEEGFFVLEGFGPGGEARDAANST